MRSVSQSAWFLIFLAGWTGLTAEASAMLLDKIVAVVNGDPITLSALENQLRFQDYSGYADVQRMRRRALEDLIEWKLMLQEAERYGKVFVLDEDVQREREKWIAKLPPGVSFEDELKRLGLTLEDVNENIRERLLIAQMSYSKFFPPDPITDEDAREYYETHASQFLETQVRWEGIYLALDPRATEAKRRTLRQRAEFLRQELESGTSLQRLAASLAGEPDLNFIPGTTPSTLESLIPALSNALARLEVLRWSHVIETPLGFFVIRLLERQRPRQKPFEEVRESIKDFLLAQQIDRRRRTWLEQAKEDADIRILDSDLAATPLATQTSYQRDHGNAPRHP